MNLALIMSNPDPITSRISIKGSGTASEIAVLRSRIEHILNLPAEQMRAELKTLIVLLDAISGQEKE